MKGLWTKNWKKALIWLCGYVHLIAFAVAGGYAVAKTADKELHETAKTVFVITLIFTAIEAVILILSGIASLGASMGTALSWIRFFVTLAKIGVYAGGLIMSLFDGGSSEEKSAEAKPAGQNEENTDGEE